MGVQVPSSAPKTQIPSGSVFFFIQITSKKREGSALKPVLRTAFIRTLPVMAGYLVLGIGFGILSLNSGFGFWWVLAMSTLIYAGSMQYVTVSLLASGASLLTAALTTLMVNARHLFYGISMIRPYQNSGRLKPYLIFSLTDETYSLVCVPDAQKGASPRTMDFLVSLLNQCYWISGSVVGAIVGKAIPFPTDGIEFAMTALFLTVLIEQWRGTGQHLPAVLGIAASLISILIFGKENFLLPAMFLISVGLLLCRNRIEK